MTSMWGAPLRSRWRGARRHDPDQARFLTLASLRWVFANKAYTPWYLVRYYRLAKFKAANPHVVLRGMVFLGKRVEIHATPELSRLEIGRWVHIGDGNAIRCHEGSLRIGDKVVFGKDNVVNTYLDIEIGDSALVADWCYICDFDHQMDDIDTPIKDQGILKGPVRIGADTWVATKVTVLRGTRIGRGCVLGVARGGEGRHPRLQHRGRRAGEGREEPQTRTGSPAPPTAPPTSRRSRTSRARSRGIRGPTRSGRTNTAQMGQPEPPIFPRGLALLVAGALFMEILDATVIATAIPAMAESFGADAVDLTSRSPRTW